MPSRIVKQARQKNAVMRVYQEIASKKTGVSVENRLKAADRLAVIVGLFPEKVAENILKDPDPAQIEFAIPEKDLESKVKDMLQEVEKIEENHNADSLHQTAGS